MAASIRQVGISMTELAYRVLLAPGRLTRRLDRLVDGQMEGASLPHLS